MKKFYHLALCAIVSLTLTACFGDLSNNTPAYSISDLQGLWQENNTEHFVRFTSEQSDEADYLYGREWNVDEDVSEQDLINSREELGHPGNGWFKYKFVTSNGELTEIHLLDNGGAEIPKIYCVTKLADGQLEYYERDHPGIKFYYTKIVSLAN